jgi:hypothetical protein
MPSHPSEGLRFGGGSTLEGELEARGQLHYNEIFSDGAESQCSIHILA